MPGSICRRDCLSMDDVAAESPRQQNRSSGRVRQHPPLPFTPGTGTSHVGGACGAELSAMEATLGHRAAHSSALSCGREGTRQQKRRVTTHQSSLMASPSSTMNCGPAPPHACFQLTWLACGLPEARGCGPGRVQRMQGAVGRNITAATTPCARTC